jgi:hypothetical protein
MREPDAWWGHLPVFWKRHVFLDEYEDEYLGWHERQVTEAVGWISKNGAVPGIIPESGFRVEVWRLISGKEVGCLIFICEDGVKEREVSEKPIVAGASKHETLESLGSAGNPFLALFDEIARKLPEAWEEYSERRRRHRPKRVPQWLREIESQALER